MSLRKQDLTTDLKCIQQRDEGSIGKEMTVTKEVLWFKNNNNNYNKLFCETLLGQEVNKWLCLYSMWPLTPSHSPVTVMPRGGIVNGSLCWYAESVSSTEILPTQHEKNPGPVCIWPCKNLGGPGKDGKEGARETQEYMGGQELCGRETVRLSVSTIRK